MTSGFTNKSLEFRLEAAIAESRKPSKGEIQTIMDNTVWHAISVTVAAPAFEAVEFAFNELASLGTEINHLGKTPSEAVTVIGYFEELPDDDLVRSELENALRIYEMPLDSIISVENSRIENKDWLAEWKKHWKPTEIGRFIIAPPWEEVNEPHKIVINIEPNMAFGTGTHETTQLCIKSIEENYKPGQTFLDVGTGTGILVIAAAKLNSKSQISDFRFSACDTDADSVKIAKENAVLNNVADRIEFYTGTISAETPQFDFICANLTIDVIVPILPMLIAKTKKALVLSGILGEQEDSIIAELRKMMVTAHKIERAGEWISMVIENGQWKTEN